jgi:hypothetical protein
LIAIEAVRRALKARIRQVRKMMEQVLRRM